MTITRNMVKGAMFQFESILCSVKNKIARSIALADTREDRNDRAVLNTKGIVQWKMPRFAGYCQKYCKGLAEYVNFHENSKDRQSLMP